MAGSYSVQKLRVNTVFRPIHVCNRKPTISDTQGFFSIRNFSDLVGHIV